MRTNNMRTNILALAVQGALLSMFALPMIAVAEGAVDDETTALTHPTNSVEVGVANVSKDSAKFGEYNGLNKSGVYGIANINLRGGKAYDDSDSVMRWQIKATDLGTTSREVGASVSNQGQWSIGVNFDELRHNLSDSYQTPYLGSMGGNNFTLPTSLTAITNTQTQKSTLLPFLHSVDIGTSRKNTSFSADYTLNPQLDFKLDINHLDQSGAKLMAFPTDPSPVRSNFGITGVTWNSSGEKIAILPNPTNYTTDTVNAALSWMGDKGHLTGSYFGSFFRDANQSVSFDNFYTTSHPVDVMTTPPNNDFHQFNLTGGYKFTPTTSLTAGLSYGRNTQNDGFVSSPLSIVNPSTASLNGVVATTHTDFKLINQSIKNLTLSAGLKYDERDNQTKSNIYNFYAIDGAIIANYPNTPLSNKKTQVEFAGDYRLDNHQHVRLAYNHEEISRWCNSYAVGLVNYPAGTNCVVATDSKEDKLGLTYKINATEDIHLNAGYSYSDRRTSNDQNAIAAFSGNQTFLAKPGLNGGDFIGFHPFFDGSRTQQILKAGADWSVNDKLSLGASGRYTDDNYNTTYGVKSGNTWSFNLDSTFNYSDAGSVFAYLTKEYRARDLTSLYKISSSSSATSLGATTPTPWANNLTDQDVTFGIGGKQTGLMAGKLLVVADLSYSLGKSTYSTEVPLTLVSTTGNCLNPAMLQCGTLPDIKNITTQVKLVADYKVNKNGKVQLGYIYRNLRSSDFYYNALQYNYTPTSLIPTNQQSGSYSVNVVSATYIYTF